MGFKRHVSGRRWFRAGLLLSVLVSWSVLGAPAQRVLILDSFERDAAPINGVASAFRTTLGRELGSRVDVYQISLDMGRFTDPTSEDSFLGFIEQRFAGHSLDLVVAVGAPAGRFSIEHRQQLFARTPIVFASGDPRLLPADFLKTNAAYATQIVKLRGIIEDILQMQPDTTNIAVVFGSSPLEKFWTAQCAEEWQQFTNRVSFSWLTGLSLPQIEERTKSLPPRSFIFFGMLIVDGEGVSYDHSSALKAIHSTANAPIFGYFKSQFGQGIVGGRLYEDARVGTEAARIAIRILRGENPANIPPYVIDSSQPVYDWRELNRWAIPLGRLPPASLIEFREPTLWTRYQWHIVGVLVFLALETALVIGLFVNRVKRRRAEAVATLIADLSSRFINLPSDRVDREIEDAQRRVCECLGLDVSSLWQWTRPEVFEMTHLYRGIPGPATPERFDARKYFPWALEQLEANRTVALTVSNAPAEAARDQETWRRFGLRTVLNLPLTVGGSRPVGLIAFNDMRRDREWTPELVQRLQVVAQVFANALARKKAEQDLRESEQRLREITENLPGVVYQFYARDDGLWGLSYLAGHVKEICGLDSEPLETFFERFTACVAPEDKQRWLDSIKDAIRNVRPWEQEARFIKPDGQEIYFRGFSRPERQGNELVFTGMFRDVTALVNAQGTLRKSEQKFRELYESMRDAFVSIGSAGQIQESNSVYRQMLGYSAEELRQLKYEDLTPERWHTTEASIILGQVLARGYSDVYEKEYLRKDGTLLPVELRTFLVREEPGKLASMWAVVRDVTERKRAETALRESEERFRQVADFVGDFIWEVDANGLYTYASPSVKRILGYDPEELVGKKHFYDLFEPSIREKLKAAALEAFARREPFRQCPNTNLSKSGTIVHMETSGMPIVDPAGNLIGYRGADTDVTARDREQDLLRESEERLRLVLEANSEGVWDWNIPSGKTFFSRHYSGMLGYTPEEFARSYNEWKLLVHPDDFERVHAAHAAHLQRGAEFCVEFRMRKKSGDWCWIRSRGTVVERDPQGRPVRMVGTHLDVTERWYSALERERLSRELAHASRISTMGALTGSFAHELNQPLSAILSNAQAGLRFLNTQLPNIVEIRGALEDIAQDTRRAGEVIRQLRALVRKDQPKLVPLDLNSLVSEVVRLIHSDLVIRRVQVKLELHSGLPTVNADSVQLQQVMLNLLLNAFDSMQDAPEDTRVATIRTRRLDLTQAQIAVCDRGVGLSPEKLRRLFEPFRSTKRDGLGLGLSICHSIVEAHKGRLWAENNPDCGATFYFTLPLHNGD